MQNGRMYIQFHGYSILYKLIDVVIITSFDPFQQ